MNLPFEPSTCGTLNVFLILCFFMMKIQKTATPKTFFNCSTHPESEMDEPGVRSLSALRYLGTLVFSTKNQKISYFLQAFFSM